MDRPVLCGGSTALGCSLRAGTGPPGCQAGGQRRRCPGASGLFQRRKISFRGAGVSLLRQPSPRCPVQSPEMCVPGLCPPCGMAPCRAGRCWLGEAGSLLRNLPDSALLRTVVGTLGLQVRTNTPLPATQVTKGDKGGGGGLPEVAKPGASAALWTLWHCQGPRHRTTEARLPAPPSGQDSGSHPGKGLRGCSSAPGCHLGLSRPFRGVKRLTKLPQRVAEGQEVVLVTAVPSLCAPGQHRRTRGSGAQAEGDGFTTRHTRPAWLRPGQRASRGAAGSEWAATGDRHREQVSGVPDQRPAPHICVLTGSSSVTVPMARVPLIWAPLLPYG